MPIEWIREYETGVQEVDAIRMAFTHSINNLESEIFNGDSRQVSHEFEYLIKSLENFFRCEEAYLVGRDEETFYECTMLHTKCRAHIRQLYSHYCSGQINSARTALNFISVWYYSYMCYPTDPALLKLKNKEWSRYV